MDTPNFCDVAAPLVPGPAYRVTSLIETNHKAMCNSVTVHINFTRCATLYYVSVQPEVSIPQVYARTRAAGGLRWQCSTYIHEQDKFETILVDDLPDWIPANEAFIGADGDPVNLRQYFQDNCQPFQQGKHLDTKKVVYYLVIRNPDYDEVDGSPVSTLFSARPIFLDHCIVLQSIKMSQINRL